MSERLGENNAMTAEDAANFDDALVEPWDWALTLDDDPFLAEPPLSLYNVRHAHDTVMPC
jgi:hypothetical protein